MGVPKIVKKFVKFQESLKKYPHLEKLNEIENTRDFQGNMMNFREDSTIPRKILELQKNPQNFREDSQIPRTILEIQRYPQNFLDRFRNTSRNSEKSETFRVVQRI